MRALHEKMALLREAIVLLRPTHFHVEEDTFYCCPQCNYCQQEYQRTPEEMSKRDRCNCGAIDVNKRIDAVLEATK